MRTKTAVIRMASFFMAVMLCVSFSSTAFAASDDLVSSIDNMIEQNNKDSNEEEDSVTSEADIGSDDATPPLEETLSPQVTTEDDIVQLGEILATSTDIPIQSANFIPLGISVSNEEELQEAFWDEDITDITLSNDIVINGVVSAWVWERELAVHLGGYSITVEEGSDFYLSGYITLQGTCTGIVQNPGAVLNLADGVHMEMHGDSSHALELHDYAGVSLGYMEIEVSGKDAVGILGRDEENPFFLRTVRVMAEGENATAAYFIGSENILVEQSTMISESGNALETEGNIYAYRSIISPVPKGSHMEDGTFRSLSPYKLRVYKDFEKGPDKLYLETDWWFYRYDYEVIEPLLDYYVTRYGDTGEFAEELPALPPCPLEWDLEGFDESTVGTYTVIGSPSPPIMLPGHPLPDISCEIAVIPPEQPCLDMVLMGYDLDDWENHWGTQPSPLLMELWLLSEVPDAQKLVVWCSEDKGESWFDITESAWFDEEIPKAIYLRGLKEETLYYFCVEVRGGSMSGYTNIFWNYSHRDDGGGGDRDMLDRDPDQYGTSPPPFTLGPDPGTTPPPGTGDPDPGAGTTPPPGTGDPDPGAGTTPPPSTGDPDPGAKTTPPSGTGDPDPEGSGNPPSGQDSGNDSGSKGGNGGCDDDPVYPNPTVTVPIISIGDNSTLTDPEMIPALLVVPASPPIVSKTEIPSGQQFSRQHILDLCAANPNAVTLFYGDVRIIIPTAALLELLGDAETINLEVAYLDKDSVSLCLWSEADEILRVEDGVTVTFPYSGNASIDGDYFLRRNGEDLSALYQNGELTATLQDLGEYTVIFEALDLPATAAAKPEQPENEESTLADANSATNITAPLIGVILLAGAAGSVYYIRKKRVH